MKHPTRLIAQGGVIAAVYVVLTLVSASVGLSSGAVQFRLGEALCALPCFTIAAIPGLTLGCAAANLLTGCAVWDVVFGSLATLAGAVGTYLLRRKNRLLACLPPILANTLVIPPVLAWVYHAEQAWWLLALTVFAGEAVSCGILGQFVYAGAKRVPSLFRETKR